MNQSLFFLVLLFFFSSFAVSQGFNETNGPWGNSVYGIAFNSQGNLFVGDQDNLWKLTNKWERVTLLPGIFSNQMSGNFKPIASRNGTMIYADSYFETGLGKLWRSTNNGSIWQEVSATNLPHTTISQFVFDSVGNIFAGSVRLSGDTEGGGVWKSTDNGDTWNLLGNQNVVGLDTSSVREILVNGNSIFVGCSRNKGIFRSTNNGTSWLQINSGLTNTTVLSLARNGDTLFCGTEGGGVFKSVDQGQVWDQTSLTTNYIFSLEFSNGVLIAGSRTDNGGLFKSTDNGSTWNSANDGLLSDVPTGLDIFSLAVNASGELFVGTESDGVFKSTNSGLSWVQLGPPVDVKQIVVRLQTATKFATAKYSFRSTDNGTSWGRINVSGTTSSVAVSLLNDVFVGSESGYGLFRSSDDGVTWSQVTFPGPEVLSLAVSADEAILAGTAGNGLYRSTNNGVNWTNVYSTPSNITAVIVSDALVNLGYLFAINATHAGGIIRSTDNGVTWTLKGLENIALRTITINKKGNIFAGGDAGVFKSTNNGEAWTSSSISPKIDGRSITATPTSVLSLAVNDADYLFAGTAGNGLYRSTDDGETWEPYSGSLGSNHKAVFSAEANLSVVSSIAIDSVGYLFAGTSEGVAKSASSTLPDPHARFSASTDTIDFGTVLLNSTDVQTVLITNNGYQTALSISNVAYANPYSVTGQSVVEDDSTVEYSITYNPQTYGVHAQSIVFTHNGATSPDTLFVTGEVIEPYAEFFMNADTVNFGVVELNSTSTQTIQIANNGYQMSLSISNVAYENPFSVSGPSSIDPDSTAEFSVVFNPLGYGSFVQAVQFTHNGATSPDTLFVMGEGAAPQFQCDSLLVFGDVQVNAVDASEGIETLRVTNIGSDTLIISSVATWHTSSFINEIFLTSPTSLSLAPSETGNFMVKFSPAAIETAWGYVRFSHNASSSPDTVRLKGYGYGRFFLPYPSPGLVFPDSVEVGTRDTLVVSIVNNGNRDLHISSVQSTNELFSIYPTSATIPRQNWLDFSIVFAPISVGEFLGALRFVHNAEDSLDTILVAGRAKISSPSPPLLGVPLNNSMTERTVEFRWGIFKDGHIWEFQLSKDSVFSILEYENSTLSDTLLTLNSLNYGAKYFWRVRASKLGVAGEWSDIWTFQVDFFTFQYSLSGGWDMVSVPVNVSDPRTSVVFQDISSSAFGYEGRYFMEDSLEKGKGYWVKSEGGSVMIEGVPRANDTVMVYEGWNIVGSISYPVAVSNVQSIPPGLIVSQFWGFNGGGYVQADSIIPGKAYWVKSSANADLIFSSENSGGNVVVLGSEEPPPLPPSEYSDNLPLEYALDQNYPNPFNPTAIISFTLPADEFVDLRVYNVLGEEVAILLNEIVSAGRHQIVFEGEKSPSGMYLYRIRAGNFIETKKMVLMK